MCMCRFSSLCRVMLCCCAIRRWLDCSIDSLPRIITSGSLLLECMHPLSCHVVHAIVAILWFFYEYMMVFYRACVSRRVEYVLVDCFSKVDYCIFVCLVVCCRKTTTEGGFMDIFSDSSGSYLLIYIVVLSRRSCSIVD